MKSILITQRLRALRRTYHLSQGELAQLIGLSSAQYVARLERGLRRPSADTLLRLKLVFDVNERVIFPLMLNAILEAQWHSTSVLRDTVLGKEDAKSKRKLELFDAILQRLALRQHRGERPLPL